MLSPSQSELSAGPGRCSRAQPARLRERGSSVKWSDYKASCRSDHKSSDHKAICSDHKARLPGRACTPRPGPGPARRPGPGAGLNVSGPGAKREVYLCFAAFALVSESQWPRRQQQRSVAPASTVAASGLGLGRTAIRGSA